MPVLRLRDVPECPVISTVTVTVGTCDRLTVYPAPAASPSSTESVLVDSTNPAVSSSVTLTARPALTPAYSPPDALCVNVSSSSAAFGSSSAVTSTV